MTKDDLIKACSGLMPGDVIKIKRKTIKMSKYGKSSKFRPRTVSYEAEMIIFEHLSATGCYLIGVHGNGSPACIYYSKINSIET